MPEFDKLNCIKGLTEDNRLSLMYVLYPDKFFELVIDDICNNFKYLIGCNYSYIINKLVDNLKYIINYNQDTKTIYTIHLDDYKDDTIQLSWIKTSNIFNNYVLSIIDDLFPKIMSSISCEKTQSKLATELKKLYNPKALEEIYNKISYKYYKNNINDIIIFKNGYLNIKTNEFTSTIIRKFDNENQYMNLLYDDYTSSMSKDHNINFILSSLNKIFYNKVNNSISLITGSNTCKLVKKINELFHTYISNISIKEFYKSDIMKKIILITSPDEIDLTKICNKLNNQHIFLCCGLKTPKIVGLINVDAFNILNVETDYFDNCSNEDLFADIINTNTDIQEPFSSNIIKESINCDCNSAEYFICSCLDLNESDEELHTEQEIYKYYLTFCKNNKLNILTVTTLIQSLQSKNISVEGDIGSRVFTGFKLK